MILIMCLDPKNGLMFNNRRQSFDRCVQKMILEHAVNRSFVVAQYSKKKFPNADAVEKLSDTIDGVCFAETEELALSSAQFADKIIVYRWDKTYPADTYFPMDLLEEYSLLETLEFEGYSHECITEEIYVRD